MSVRALVAYSASSTHVQTTFDYLLAFKNYSEFLTKYVNVTHDSVVDFDFSEFDVVFHNYCARLCFDWYVSESYRKRLSAFNGVKILAVQDEYDRTDTLKAAIKEIGFDIVLTCIPQDALEYVYPKAEFPDVTFITVFTGYVSDDFEARRPPALPLAERPVLIGYRGRDIGGRYGRLGFDKFEIGRRMKEICDARGVKTDIAMDEASRIYGMAWFDYLGRCRAMLGTESGSNVFDFDGAIEERFKAMSAANGGVPPSYAEFLPVVAARDGEIDMGQVSPRVFECALMRTPMVLFRGRYSDAIEPNVHYIALEKDFSNIDQVLTRLEDIPALEAMTDRAYVHLVASGRFSYRTFFGMVGDVARAHPKLSSVKRQRQEPIASAAGQRSFLVRNWQAIERPSAFPDGAELFNARASLSEIGYLEAENVRLTREFGELRTVCTQALDQLAEPCRVTCRRFADLGQIASDFSRAAELKLHGGEFSDFLAAADREDALSHSEWEDLVSRVAQAEEDGTIDLAALIAEALAMRRRRHAAMSLRFADFQTLYQSERQRVERVVSEVHRRLLIVALPMFVTGIASPKRLISIIKTPAKATIREALGRCGCLPSR